MFWSVTLLGTDIYHLIAAFCVYSILGWMVESIYMSVCNRKLTNRGFAKGPFCPIYGIGASGAYILFEPLRSYPVILYFTGAVTATVFEFLVAKLMLKLFGEVWWDYQEKPFNYQGIICLESTVAWGFYAVGIVYFLHRRVVGFIDLFPSETGITVISVILTVVLIDYIIQLMKAFKVDVKKSRDALMERCRNFIAR